MADPIILPSAPIILFEEYSDPKAGDYLVIVELASGKTFKIKAQYFGQSSPSTSYKWIATFDYPVDAIVEYQGKWYRSLQTPNLGKAPATNPDYWQEVNKSAQGFVFWTPGVYTGDPVLVLYEIVPGQVEIYQLTAAQPFYSSDFEAELAAGDWQIVSGGQKTFKGVFASEAALNAAHPTAEPGDYALVDTGGTDAQLFIWDETDSVWIASGVVTITTPGAPDTAVQFNDGGVFAGDVDLKWDKTNKVLLFGNARLFNKSALNNIFFGNGAGNLAATGNYNIGLGFQTQIAANGVGNTSIGYAALAVVTGSHNIAIGTNALTALLNANANLAIGYGTLAAEQSGTGNVALGDNSLPVQNGGVRNTAIGNFAGYAVGNGTVNTFIGFRAGILIVNGTGNVALGQSASPPTPNGDNQLSIQNAIFGVANAGVDSTISTGRIGLYVVAPTARLHLPAGQSAANNAPMKMEQGPLLSTTELGAMEFDSVTGDLYFTTPSARVNLTGRDQTRQAAAISGGTLTLDVSSKQERNFDLTTTVSSNFTIAFSNTSNWTRSKLTLRVTGTVAITMPAAAIMDSFEFYNGRWAYTTNILTVVGSTASPFMFEFVPDSAGNIWVLATNNGI